MTDGLALPSGIVKSGGHFLCDQSAACCYGNCRLLAPVVIEPAECCQPTTRMKLPRAAETTFPEVLPPKKC
jgi:hypothetical protein